jgi:hypothetical protein
MIRQSGSQPTTAVPASQRKPGRMRKMVNQRLKSMFAQAAMDLSSHITFLLTGVICGSLAALLLIYQTYISSNFGEFNHHLMTAILAEASLIFLAAAVVERTLLEKYSNSITTLIRRSLDDARYAAHYNVHLLPPRRSEGNMDVSYLKIAEAIDRARWVNIFCTSGIDLFHNPSAGRMPISTALISRITTENSLPFDITVLSCKPNGKYANIRQFLENPNSKDSISKDISEAVRHFEQTYQRAHRRNEVRFRWLTYDFTPQCWFLLTDAGGFVETYHFGLGIRDKGLQGTCIGGRMPLLQCTAGATLYRAMKQYFNFLIEQQAPDVEERKNAYFEIESLYDSGDLAVGLAPRSEPTG